MPGRRLDALAPLTATDSPRRDPAVALGGLPGAVDRPVRGRRRPGRALLPVLGGRGLLGSGAGGRRQPGPGARRRRRPRRGRHPLRGRPTRPRQVGHLLLLQRAQPAAVRRAAPGPDHAAPVGGHGGPGRPRDRPARRQAPAPEHSPSAHHGGAGHPRRDEAATCRPPGRAARCRRPPPPRRTKRAPWCPVGGEVQKAERPGLSARLTGSGRAGPPDSWGTGRRASHRRRCAHRSRRERPAWPPRAPWRPGPSR